MIDILCKNNGQTIQLDYGTTVEEVYDLFKLNMEKKPVCAIVNNKVQGLRYRIFNSKTIELVEPGNAMFGDLEERMEHTAVKDIRSLRPTSKLRVFLTDMMRACYS